MNLGFLYKLGAGILLTSGVGVAYLALQDSPANDIDNPQETDSQEILTAEREPMPLEDMQIGLNFIRVFLENATAGRPNENTSSELDDPDWIFNDFEELGVQVYRQATEGDLLWENVEERDDSWTFTYPDQFLNETAYEPVVTLFALQYASPTPPWETNPKNFQKTLGTEATDYLDTVLERYGDQVKYWEIGNEMDHWRAADPQENASGAEAPGADSLPKSAPLDGFTPYEQGVFLAQVADYIRSKDADAVIVLPGMSGLEDYILDTWLEGVVEGGGTDFFDVVNYHYYGPYDRFENARSSLTEKLAELGISDKPVWLTETGISSDPSMTRRTNYPNSENVQAAEVFRRLIQAYASGDSMVLWHTHVSSSDDGSKSDWRSYGLRTLTGRAKPAWYAFQLLAEELIPFTSVEKIDSARNTLTYKITLESGEIKYVAWGSGTYEAPTGMTEFTSVAFEGEAKWSPLPKSGSVTLSEIPVLIR